MVDELDSDHCRRLGHAAREQPILGAGRWIAGWMGLEEDETGGAAEEALLEDLARLDRGPVEGTAIDLLMTEEAVGGIQKQCAHQFLVTLLVAQGQETRYLIGSTEGLSVRHAPASKAAGDLAGGQESWYLGVAEAVVPEHRSGHVRESGKAAAHFQERSRETRGLFEAPTSSEQETKQVGVRKRVEMVFDGIWLRAGELRGLAAALVGTGLGRCSGRGRETEDRLARLRVGEGADRDGGLVSWLA